MSKRIFLFCIFVLLIVIGLLPVLSMLVKSLTANGRLSFSSYSGVLTSAHQWKLMWHSLVLSTLVTMFTIIIGVPLGILLGKTNLHFRRGFTILFVIPLLIPPYIIAVSWFDLLGRDGLLTGLLTSSLTNVTSRLLFGLPGCIIVLFSVFLPIPMLLTMIFLRTINPRLEEAGRLVSGWRQVLKGITIPLVLPGIMLSAILVFILSFGEFSVPNFLRFDVFPVESFTQFSAFYNFKAATAAALPLAVVTLVVLIIESGFLHEKTYQLRPASDAERLPPMELGKMKKPLFFIVASLALVIVVIPIVVLVIQSANIGTYEEAIRRAGSSLLRSLIYASVGATSLTIMGFFTGYLIQTRALKIWRTADTLTIFLFALPSTVIGIGLISLWNTRWTDFVYGTPIIIILGYLAKYTALTSRISVTQLSQVSPSMEEAARVAGAGWFRRIFFIVSPLVWRGLLASWLVGYIFSIRDTGITMLVYPAGHETLPVRIFTLMANGSPRLIAALCVIMIAAILLPALMFWMVPGITASRRKEIKCPS